MFNSNAQYLYSKNRMYVSNISPACVWSVKVWTHSALEKSQILTVVSPLDVANFVPLKIINGNSIFNNLFDNRMVMNIKYIDNDD